ncbi:MAG: ABC transporter substrate-binding protein [Verrucomicrobium sp.]
MSKNLLSGARRGSAAHWAWRLVGLLAAVACLLYGTFAGRPPEADQPMRVAIGVWPGSDTLVYARETGSLPRDDVQLMEMAWSSATKVAFVNRVVDAAVISLDEVLRLLESGDDLRVVMVLGFSRGGDAVLARPPIASVKELRGRKVGVESNSVGAYVLAGALAGENLTLRDLEVLPLNLAEMQNAYDVGEVDAVVVGEPWGTRIRSLGAQPIFDSNQLSNQVCRVLVVRPEILKKMRQKVDKVVQAHLRSRNYLHTGADPLVVDAISRRSGISRAELTRAFDQIAMPDLEENRRLLGGASPKLRQIASEVATQMVREGLLNGIPARKDWISDEFLEELP